MLYIKPVIAYSVILMMVSGSTLAQNLYQPDSFQVRSMSPKGYEDPGLKFRNFDGVSLDEIRYTQDSLSGKTTFINFWFETCAPCIAEMPALNELYDSLKGNNDFRFLSFTWDTPVTARKNIKRYNIHFPVICLSPLKTRKLIFDELGYPTNMVVDAKGMVRYIKCGGNTNPSHAREMVKALFMNQIQRIIGELN